MNLCVYCVCIVCVLCAMMMLSTFCDMVVVSVSLSVDYSRKTCTV